MARTSGTWTTEQARQHASSAGKARWDKWRSRRDMPPMAPVHAAQLPAAMPPVPHEFVVTRLSRVRAQLDRLDQLLAAATDTKAIKELADATKRLQDQERELSGRPLPGSRRPAPEPSPGARQPQRPPAAPITRPDPSPAKQGEVHRASQLNASGASADGNSSARSTFGRDEPGITTPLPMVEQPRTPHSVAPDRHDPDEPDGIEYGPID